MYKYRHYSPELGRWPARDPIEEKGGVNLYAFVGNDSISRWDSFGLSWKYTVLPPALSLGRNAAETSPALNSFDYKLGSDKIVESIKNCCAVIKEAKEFKSHIETQYTQDAAVLAMFTKTGWTTVQQHERRRKDVYKNAYDKYFKLSSKKGAIALAPGKFCCTKPGEAKAILQDYLTRMSASMMSQASAYIWKENKSISDEYFKPNLKTNKKGQITGIINAHTVLPAPVPAPISVAVKVCE